MDDLLTLADKVGHVGTLPSLILGVILAWRVAGVLFKIRETMDTMHAENRKDIGDIKERVAKIEGHLGIGA